MQIFKDSPNPEQLISWFNSLKKDTLYEVNGHVHTPYSFSAFTDIPQMFTKANQENIKVLGINDFNVATGYPSFLENAITNRVFPLFNIEFIGLLKDEQAHHIRINDPNNPGRCYFSGKGLSYPFSLPKNLEQKLNQVIAGSQVQVLQMVDKANAWFRESKVDIQLNFNEIKIKYAQDLVRERHIAKAIRVAVFENTNTDKERTDLFYKMYGSKEVKAAITDIPSLENEIRGNLLKSGGKAFVEEDDNAFMDIDEVISIILAAGGIPCYPVLLDDKNGNYTEYEADKESLFKQLTKRNISCIELIPGRNDFNHLKEFVSFFHNKGFVILFGTEHNAPGMIPLTCDTRGKKPLDNDLRKIAFEGACIVASHQYLKSRNLPAWVNEQGIANSSKREYYIQLGKALIERFINN